MFQLAPIASRPVPVHLWEEFGSVSSVFSIQAVADSNKISPKPSLPTNILASE